MLLFYCISPWLALLYFWSNKHSLGEHKRLPKILLILNRSVYMYMQIMHIYKGIFKYMFLQFKPCHAAGPNKNTILFLLSFCLFRGSVQRVEMAGTTATPTSPAPWTRKTSAECLTTAETSSSACTYDSTNSCDRSRDDGTQTHHLNFL